MSVLTRRVCTHFFLGPTCCQDSSSSSSISSSSMKPFGWAMPFTTRYKVIIKDNNVLVQAVTREEEGMFYLTTHSNTFYLRLYDVRHMVKDHSAKEETRYHHIGYSFQLAARVLLYASFHRLDNTYHSLCYTSRGTLAGMRNSS